MITEFLKPKTIGEAVHFKQANPDAIYIAGGSWINSSRSKLAPETVVSLEKLGLNEIKKDKNDIVIGATATLQEILDNPETPLAIKNNLLLLRNRNIRNQGTLAGTIAARQPAFSILTVLVAMGAHLDTTAERIPVEKYLHSSDSSLILDIRASCTVRVCSKKHSVTARGVSLVSVAAGIDGDKIRLVLAQDGGKIERLSSVEKTLDAKHLPGRDELAKQISNAVISFDDYRTSAAFKKHIAGVMLADCLIEAAKGA